MSKKFRITPQTAQDAMLRMNWLYNTDEHEYVDKLVAIMRGRNKQGASAIRKTIDAFYNIRDFVPGLRILPF